jgi:hypothetical protein
MQQATAATTMTPRCQVASAAVGIRPLACGEWMKAA